MNFRKRIRKSVQALHLGILYDILNFLISLKMTLQARKCRINYTRTLARLTARTGDRKIKVLFIVSEPSKWKCQKLYEVLNASDKFSPVVGISAWNCQSDLDDITLDRHLENAKAFFEQLGDNYITTVSTHPRKFMELSNIKPDVIIYNEQWRPCASQHPVIASRYALTFFIPYYVPVFGNMFIHCQQPIEQLSFAYFTLNNEWSKLFAPYFKAPHSVAQLIPLGHPALDYFDGSDNASRSKDYVIFAPHFAIPQNNQVGDWVITQSTFDWSGKAILRYAKMHPETNWVFKPHPLLRTKLVEIGFMTEKEMDDYYAEWEEIGKVCCSGDYQELFRDSLTMLTDSGSFLAEYAATGHPLIHLWCHSNNIQIPRPTQLLMDSFYRVTNEKELFSTLKLLVEDRRDPKCVHRRQTIQELQLCGRNASSRIAAYLENLLNRKGTATR